MLRSFLLKLLLSVLSLAVCFTLFEYFGTALLKRKMGREYYATIDHYPLPNDKGFNEDGVRTYRNSPVSEFRADTYNIIFLGDSFTMGLRAERGLGHVAFPFQLNRLMEEQGVSPAVRVANFGWVSSSPILDYRRLVLLGHKYRPRLVILCVDVTDFWDDPHYRQLLSGGNPFSPTRFMLERSGLMAGWNSVKTRLGVGDDAVPSDHFFIVNQPLSKSEKYLGEIERNIKLLYGYSRDTLKARFILVLLPRCFQYSRNESRGDPQMYKDYTPMGPYSNEPVAWLEKYRQTVPFPAFSLLDDFKNSNVFPTCFDNDPHYNRLGHRVAGEAIFKILKRLSREGYLDLKFPQ